MTSTPLNTYQSVLPEVTTGLENGLYWHRNHCSRIWDATAAMADRMADWAVTNWKVDTEADLDRYTFGVAGAVGLLLSDLWAWYDGRRTVPMLSGLGLTSCQYFA